MKFMILALLLASPSLAKDRKPAAVEEGKCYANFGAVGSLKGVTKEVEEILTLKDCLKHSSSEFTFEIPTTYPGVAPARHFIAKIRAKETPYFFRMGEFHYHFIEGKLIGVTKVGL